MQPQNVDSSPVEAGTHEFVRDDHGVLFQGRWPVVLVLLEKVNGFVKFPVCFGRGVGLEEVTVNPVELSRSGLEYPGAFLFVNGESIPQSASRRART